MISDRFHEECLRKRQTPHESVLMVRDGDYVDDSNGVCFSYSLNHVLARRKGKRKDIKAREDLALRLIQIIEQGRAQISFTYQGWHCS